MLGTVYRYKWVEIYLVDVLILNLVYNWYSDILFGVESLKSGTQIYQTV